MSAGLRVNNIAPVGERPSDLIRGRVGVAVAGVGTMFGVPLASGPTNAGDLYVYDPGTETWVIVNSSTFGSGADGAPGRDGVDGVDGQDGVNGQPGPDGRIAYQDHGSTGSTETVSWSVDVHRLLLDSATVTLSVANVPSSGTPAIIRLLLVQDGSGGRAVTWWSSITWVGGSAPTLASAAGAITSVDVMTVDGGSSYLGTVAVAGVATGTAFPGGPATNAQFFRTDYGLPFYYDGTQWVSAQLNQAQVTSMDAVLPLSAGGALRGIVPVWAGSDIYLVSTQTWFFVSGGSALSASHKWVGTVTKLPAATTLATVTIDSGASNTHRQSTLAAINALLGATNFELETTWVKTGTPGSLYAITTISYRYVAT